MSVAAAPLPDGALLARYAGEGGHFTDCFRAEIARPVDMPDYARAFYGSSAFWPEARILHLWLKRPVRAEDAVAMARGETDAFAAWTVEDRARGQLLLRDLKGHTRSWLAIDREGEGTVLWFGSAVIGGSAGGVGWRAMLAFHAAYSRALLGAAARRLRP